MMEDKFTNIFKKNEWGDRESVSGPGSTLVYTVGLREELKNLFEKFNIHKVFDAPCGDFNWMKEVVNQNDIEYLGGDIVKEIIDLNKDNFQNSKTNFTHLDITSSIFPNYDLWICRDCFIHLSYDDILLSLKNFCNSNIPYILTTSHINNNTFINNDIETGGFRYIDLFSFPFNFPENPLYRIEDWRPPYKAAEMLLFTKDQIKSIINVFEQNKNV